MSNLTRTMTKYLRNLFRPQAVTVGIAVCNFMVYYLEAARVRGLTFCFGMPWYASPTWSNFPLLLLIAALCLYLGRRWSLLAAVAFSAPVLYQGVVDNLPGFGLSSWWDWTGYQPGLLVQYVLATALMWMAARAMGRAGKR